MGMKQPTGTKPTKGAEALQKLKRELSLYFHEGQRFHSAIVENVTRYYDYYDGDQLTAEDIDALDARDQPPIIFNQIQAHVDAVVGTEDRTKLDMSYRPRGANDAGKADLYAAAAKSVEDGNGTDFEVSSAFFQQAVGGLGWIYCGFNPDPEGPRILEEFVDWRDMRIDPFATKYDLSDARFIIRRAWVDVEEAVSRYPEYEKAIRESVGGASPGDQAFSGVAGFDSEEERVWDMQGTLFGWRADEWIDSTAKRVLLCECYYRVHEKRTLLRRELTDEVSELDPNKPTMQQVMVMLEEPHSIMDAAPVRRIRMAVFAGPNILCDEPSPYAHNRFPFIPFWGKRKFRTGEPFGIVKNMLDPQDIVNTSFSKMMYAMGMQQVWHEIGAVKDVDLLEEQANDPGAQIELNPGGLDKIQRERWENSAAMHQQVMAMAGTLLGENTGTTESFMGQKSNETSGYAIDLRQQAAGVTLAALFKNYRKSLKLLAEIRIPLIQQAFTGPMFVRLTDDPNAEATIANDLLYIPEANQYIPVNALQGNKVDVVISATAHQSSIRQAFAEQLMQLISRLPDQAVMGLIDIPIEMADPPSKEKILERIRAFQMQFMGMNTSAPTGGNNGGGNPPLATPGSISQPRSAAPVGGR